MTTSNKVPKGSKATKKVGFNVTEATKGKAQTGKVSITIPKGEAINYRERVLHQILSKVLGTSAFIVDLDKVHFKGTKEQAIVAQTLANVHIPDMDNLVEALLLAFARRNNLIVEDDIQLIVKK